MDEQFQVADDWLPFHATPTKPVFVPPEGAVDAHCHVFGPGVVFPFAEERTYTPSDASKESLWALRDFIGFERNVIVQATCHGSDNRALVDALVHSDGKSRGVATLRSSVSDAELAQLHTKGIRGARFNFVHRLTPPPPRELVTKIAERISRLGWHSVVYFESNDLPELFDFFQSLPGVIVVDHMGRPDVGLGANSAEFDTFIRLMASNERIYSKVSCPERISNVGPPTYSDVVPFAKRVVEEFPDRVLWGTDWPHPNMKSHMPDDGHLVDYIPAIATTRELQHKLLVDNPMKLYWSEEVNQ